MLTATYRDCSGYVVSETKSMKLHVDNAKAAIITTIFTCKKCNQEIGKSRILTIKDVKDNADYPLSVKLHNCLGL